METIDQPRNPESLLLRTKITIPRIPADFVRRPRLTEQIDRGVQGPLTIVSAPAGFGKTNLLVEWSNTTHLPVAWFSLDSDDNHLARFTRYLVGAFQILDPNFGQESVDFISSVMNSQSEARVALLSNEIAALSKELVLVVDDFHVLEDKNVLKGISFFVKHQPRNLHLIIASRSQPTAGLAALRAKGQVIDLGMEDLRFTEVEVEQFFHEAMGLRLPPDVIQTLANRTDGWVTGLQMAAISLRHQSDPSTLLLNMKRPSRYLVNFLAEEVLDKQTEDIRQFLLKSSILDTLTGPLCEAVVNPQAQPGFGTVMLNRLEDANLFITALDERHHWFRYHPLFADFLCQIHAEINPGEIPVLKKRAAEWFEQNGNLDKAIQYALDSNDMEWAGVLIERNIPTLIKTGDIIFLADWIARLPDEVIHQRPVLGLTYAWGLIAASRLDLARYWMDDVRRRISELEGQTEGPSLTGNMETREEIEANYLWNVRGGLAICQSAMAVLSGDLEQAAEFSKEAASYLQEENPFIQSFISLDDSMYFLFSGDTSKAIESMWETIRISRRANNLVVQIMAICQLADMQALHGRLSQALATLQKAQYLVLGSENKPLLISGLVDIGMGEILFEQGALAEAGTYLERGVQASQNLWMISSLDGMVSLARLRQAQGDYAGSQAVITQAWQLSNSMESSQWDDEVICAVAVRLALMREDLAEAEQWWRRGGFPSQTEKILLKDYPYHVFEFLQITQARFLLVTGEVTGNEDHLRLARELLEMLQSEARRFERVTSQIEILILLAKVQAALNDDQAKNSMLEALALGEPAGYWQIYADEGWKLSALLVECLSAQQASGSYLPTPAFVERLLSALPKPEGELLVDRPSFDRLTGSISATMEDGFPITLSAREMEVLRLVAEGKSNQEISAELYLALNTVKRHVYNIFAKLEVKKRTQAVSRARQLGLIQ